MPTHSPKLIDEIAAGLGTDPDDTRIRASLPSIMNFEDNFEENLLLGAKSEAVTEATLQVAGSKTIPDDKLVPLRTVMDRLVDDLAAAIDGETDTVRTTAVHGLLAVGTLKAHDALLTRGPRVVESLILALSNRDSVFTGEFTIADNAALVLRELGTEAVPALIAGLDDHQYSRAVAAILEETPGALQSLMSDLASDDARTTEKAVQRLLSVGSQQSLDALVAAGAKVAEPLILTLDSGCRIGTKCSNAISVLTELGEQAVPALISRLGQSRHRRLIIHILVEIKDQRAVRPLVDLLILWGVGPRVASALSTFDWLPTTPREHVDLAVATRCKTCLLEDWPRTKAVLLGHLLGRDGREAIEGALYAFIAAGNEEVIPELVDVLNRVGSKIMAETYLNCGNQELSVAARAWANRHGYRIIGGKGASAVHWGRF